MWTNAEVSLLAAIVLWGGYVLGRARAAIALAKSPSREGE